MNTEKDTCFYMANLWSEIEKIFVWKNNNNDEAMLSALNRALPILDKIKDLNSDSATSETSILKDVLLDLINSENKYKVNRQQLSAYLYPFAFRVAKFTT